MRLPVPVAFEWDRGNLDKNWKKHKVYFKEAEEIFFNRPVKFFPSRKHTKQEKRYLAYGITDYKRKLTIVFTIRNKKIRIISARPMNRKERRIYEKENQSNS